MTPVLGTGGTDLNFGQRLIRVRTPNLPAVRAFGWMRQVRNSSAYPEPDGATATEREVRDGIDAAHAIIQVAEKVAPVMPVYGR